MPSQQSFSEGQNDDFGEHMRYYGADQHEKSSSTPADATAPEKTSAPLFQKYDESGNVVDTPFENSSKSTEKRKFTFFKYSTLFSLAFTLMGIYLSMFALGTVTPLMKEEYTEAEIGDVLAYSRLARIPVKFLVGPLVDAIGGKPMFVLGEILVGISTLFFALPISSSVTYLTICWAAMQMSNTFCWPSVVQVANRWITAKETGRVLGFLSLGYLFGDGIARGYLAVLVAFGMTWRWVLITAAITLFIIAVIAFIAIRPSPQSLGLSDPNLSEEENALLKKKRQYKSGEDQEYTSIVASSQQISYTEPEKPQINELEEPNGQIDVPAVVASDTAQVQKKPKQSLKERLASFGPALKDRIKRAFHFLVHRMLPIFLNVRFWIIALIYTGITCIRYVFNDWWASYFVSVLHSSQGAGAATAVLFPISGGFGVIFMGWLQDRLTPLKRSFCLLAFNIVIVLLCFLFWLMNVYVDLNAQLNGWLIVPPLLLYILIGFCVLAVYSLPGGALAVRLGGRGLSATIAAVLDGIGTVGASLSGKVGKLLLDGTKNGWNNAFAMQIGVGAGVVALSFIFVLIEIFDSVRADEAIIKQEREKAGEQVIN